MFLFGEKHDFGQLFGSFLFLLEVPMLSGQTSLLWEAWALRCIRVKAEAPTGAAPAPVL